MSGLHSMKKPSLALLIVLAIMGCNEKPAIDSVAPKKINPSTKTTKPGAAIKLSSSATLAISPFESVHSEIFLETTERSGDLTIGFSTSQGLTLINPESPQLVQIDNSGSIKIPVTLQTSGVGRYYLNMHISLNNGNSISVRNLAVIVQAGALLENDMKLQKNTGENTIKLPAKETISPE